MSDALLLNKTVNISADIGYLAALLHKDFEQRAMKKVLGRGHSKIRITHSPLFCNLSCGPMRLTLLAKYAGVTQQAMGKLVKQMEKEGYIKRHEDNNDKRAKIIELTHLGKQLITDYMASVEEVTEVYREIFGTEEVQKLIEQLERVIKKLSNRPFFYPSHD